MLLVQVPQVRAEYLLQGEEHVAKLKVLIVSRGQHFQHLDDCSDGALVDEATVEHFHGHQVVLPQRHACLQGSPIVLAPQTLNILKALLSYPFQLLSFKIEPLVVLVAEFDVHFLLIGEDEVISRRHSDRPDSVRNQLEQTLLAKVRNHHTQVLYNLARSCLLFLNFCANPELLISGHVQKQETVLPQRRRSKKEDERIQKLLKLGHDHFAILIELDLRGLPVADHALDLVEEALNDLLRIEEEVGIEGET
jgi:hypothetical protein